MPIVHQIVQQEPGSSLVEENSNPEESARSESSHQVFALMILIGIIANLDKMLGAQL